MTEQETARELGKKLVAHRIKIWTKCRVCGIPIHGYATMRFCGNTHQRQDYRRRLTMVGQITPGEIPTVDEIHGDPEGWLIGDPDHEATPID